MEVSLAMFTVHFSYYKRRLDILRYSVQMKDSAFPLSLLSVSVPNVTYPSNNFIKAKYFTVTKPTNLSQKFAHYTRRAVLCMFYLRYSQRSTGNCSESGYLPDARGRANSIRIRYMWTQMFLNPQQKLSGFKSIWISVDGALA